MLNVSKDELLMRRIGTGMFAMMLFFLAPILPFIGLYILFSKFIDAIGASEPEAE